MQKEKMKIKIFLSRFIQDIFNTFSSRNTNQPMYLKRIVFMLIILLASVHPNVSELIVTGEKQSYFVGQYYSFTCFSTTASIESGNFFVNGSMHILEFGNVEYNSQALVWSIQQMPLELDKTVIQCCANLSASDLQSTSLVTSCSTNVTLNVTVESIIPSTDSTVETASQESSTQTQESVIVDGTATAINVRKKESSTVQATLKDSSSWQPILGGVLGVVFLLLFLILFLGILFCYCTQRTSCTKYHNSTELTSKQETGYQEKNAKAVFSVPLQIQYDKSEKPVYSMVSGVLPSEQDPQDFEDVQPQLETSEKITHHVGTIKEQPKRQPGNKITRTDLSKDVKFIDEDASSLGGRSSPKLFPE